MSNYSAPFGRLVIDLDAAARNWLYLRKKLSNGTDCAAVVKADAYGLGASEISRALFEQGCRHFFVAQADEAVAVKAALPSGEKGQQSAIYILNGPRGMGAKDMTAEGFIPVLNTPEDIEYWAGEKRPAVIHIDTGMNRLGLTASDVKRLVLQKDLLSGLDIRYVMSHLSCSDNPAHPKNGEQLALFQELSAAMGRPFRYSFANSGGIFLGNAYHFDLARPGCAIYGINPTPTAENPMQPVVSLSGTILQVRDIETPGTVGYGAGYKVSPPAKTATVSVGYADGYLRSTEGRGRVFIGGISCPVIGRVSMDLIVADVSHLPQPPRAGDAAEIIGRHQSVDDVAAQAGTIGYEILTGLGRRMKRIYEGSGA